MNDKTRLIWQRINIFFFHSPQLKRQQSFCLQAFNVCLSKERHQGPLFTWQFWMAFCGEPGSTAELTSGSPLRPTDRLNVLYEPGTGYKRDSD